MIGLEISNYKKISEMVNGYLSATYKLYYKISVSNNVYQQEHQ